MRKVAIIPTLLTLGNAVCGFAAIAYASKIDQTEASEYYFAVSGWLIIAAMVFDMMDGYVARLSKTASKFGGELDSLCDGISFGLAPAFVLMRMGPGWEPRPLLHQLLAGIAALYMVCTLLRLARFNVENTPDPASHKRFRGLPSPGAAGCLASLAILRGNLSGQLDTALVRSAIEVWATVGAFVIALLMVSRVPYPHVTKQFLNQTLKGRRHFKYLIQFIVVAVLVFVIRELCFILAFWFYALALPIRHLVMRSLHPGALPAPAAPGVDETLPQ